MFKFNMKMACVMAVMALVGSGPLFAVVGDPDDTAVLSLSVQECIFLDISGNPAAMEIAAPLTAGGSFVAAAQETSTTYGLTMNSATAKKITATCTQLPDTTKLTITLTAPTTGVAAAVTFTNADDDGVVTKDCVTSIDAVNESGKTIKYDFAPDGAGMIPADAGPHNTTVTLNVVAE